MRGDPNTKLERAFALCLLPPVDGAFAGAAPGRENRKLVPYHQGSLDGLCGLYSVINAVQLATRSSAALGDDTWQELLYALAVATDDTVGLTTAMACGLNTGALFAILRVGIQHMADEHDIHLKARRLLTLDDRPSLDLVLQRLERTIGAPNSGVVLSLSGQLDHWTVPRKITPTTLELFDSSGHQRVRLSNLRMSYEAALSKSVEHVIYPRAIFCIEVQ